MKCCVPDLYSFKIYEYGLTLFLYVFAPQAVLPGTGGQRGRGEGGVGGIVAAVLVVVIILGAAGIILFGLYIKVCGLDTLTYTLTITLPLSYSISENVTHARRFEHTHMFQC